MDNNKYHYSVEGVNYDVVIEEIEGNIARVNVNGKSSASPRRLNP